MNFKKTLFTALIAMGCMTASAQEQPKTEYVFKPHWYLQLQAGGQETIGEVSFKNLVSPNAQLGIGYQFDKVWGARLAVNAWQSKGGSHYLDESYHWKWNYVAPTVDITADLTNLFGGYKAKRPVSFGLFAGLGANIGFNNGEAADVESAMSDAFNAKMNGLPMTSNSMNDQYLRLLWGGTKARFLGHFGANFDVRVCDAVKIGLEVSANTLPDAYNSKKAGNSDWYFNGLLGVKVNLGKAYKTRIVQPKPRQESEPRVIERIIEKVVEKQPAPAAAAAAAVEKVEPLRRDVFFVIRGTTIAADEMQKVRDIADYLNKYPNAKVTITGYADKGTGNATINKNLSVKRANIVSDTLQKQFGISAARITVDSKGDTEQPYAEQVKNRVSICIAE